MSTSQPKLPPIVHSCYFASSSRGEQFTSVHTFSYQEAGKIVANDGNKEYVFDEGEFRFTVGKKLAKYYKIPPPNGAFKSIAIFFDEEMLREMSAIHGFTATQKPGSDIFLKLTPHQAYKDLFNSLIPYLDADQTLDKELLNLKAREALLVIMKVNPELKDILFDFSKPGKIDLETFMQKNYHFKVNLERFAFLTGRSLATFKRDFEKIFNISPSRWLTQRRLQQAYYLIKEMGKRPSEIYVDLGFEDFSHFTYAFRQLYGASPTKI